MENEEKERRQTLISPPVIVEQQPDRCTVSDKLMLNGDGQQTAPTQSHFFTSGGEDGKGWVSSWEFFVGFRTLTTTFGGRKKKKKEKKGSPTG